MRRTAASKCNDKKKKREIEFDNESICRQQLGVNRWRAKSWDERPRGRQNHFNVVWGELADDRVWKCSTRITLKFQTIKAEWQRCFPNNPFDSGESYYIQAFDWHVRCCMNKNIIWSTSIAQHTRYCRTSSRLFKWFFVRAIFLFTVFRDECCCVL